MAKIAMMWMIPDLMQDDEFETADACKRRRLSAQPPAAVTPDYMLGPPPQAPQANLLRPQPPASVPTVQQMQLTFGNDFEAITRIFNKVAAAAAERR